MDEDESLTKLETHALNLMKRSIGFHSQTVSPIAKLFILAAEEGRDKSSAPAEAELYPETAEAN